MMNWRFWRQKGRLYRPFAGRQAPPVCPPPAKPTFEPGSIVTPEQWDAFMAAPAIISASEEDRFLA